MRIFYSSILSRRRAIRTQVSANRVTHWPLCTEYPYVLWHCATTSVPQIKRPTDSYQYVEMLGLKAIKNKSVNQKDDFCLQQYIIEGSLALSLLPQEVARCRSTDIPIHVFAGIHQTLRLIFSSPGKCVHFYRNRIVEHIYYFHTCEIFLFTLGCSAKHLQ